MTEDATEARRIKEEVVLVTLVDRAQQGDKEAFGTLTQLVGDRCMAIAYRILRDADLAADAVQTALVAAWRDLPALRDLTGSSPGCTGFSSASATRKPSGGGALCRTLSGSRRSAAITATRS